MAISYLYYRDPVIHAQTSCGVFGMRETITIPAPRSKLHITIPAPRSKQHITIPAPRSKLHITIPAPRSKQHITIPPTTARPRRRSKQQFLSVLVYCSCKRPDSLEQMIQCDQCDASLVLVCLHGTLLHLAMQYCVTLLQVHCLRGGRPWYTFQFNQINFWVRVHQAS